MVDMHGTSLKHISSFFLLLSLVAFCKPVFAQISPAQAREMLAGRGISEDTLRTRLVKKGFDPEQIRPDQIDKFQTVILETIREIEGDQRQLQQEGEKKTEKEDLILPKDE